MNISLLVATIGWAIIALLLALMLFEAFYYSRKGKERWKERDEGIEETCSSVQFTVDETGSCDLGGGVVKPD